MFQTTNQSTTTEPSYQQLPLFGMCSWNCAKHSALMTRLFWNGQWTGCLNLWLYNGDRTMGDWNWGSKHGKPVFQPERCALFHRKIMIHHILWSLGRNRGTRFSQNGRRALCPGKWQLEPGQCCSESKLMLIWVHHRVISPECSMVLVYIYIYLKQLGVFFRINCGTVNFSHMEHLGYRSTEFEFFMMVYWLTYLGYGCMFSTERRWGAWHGASRHRHLKSGPLATWEATVFRIQRLNIWRFPKVMGLPQ